VTPILFDEPRSRLYLGCAGTTAWRTAASCVSTPRHSPRMDVAPGKTRLGGDVMDIVFKGRRAGVRHRQRCRVHTAVDPLVARGPAGGWTRSTSAGRLSLADAE
jgi:hypothetical protein